MRQLSQLEKRLLRIIALQQQMEATGAVGDFAKTIDYTANQLKQLQETFKEISRWIAQYFMFALQPVVEYTLSFAIAIRELLKYLNIVSGYVYEKPNDKKGLFGEQSSEIDEANKSLEEYKRNLLGFDSINTLGEDESTSTEDIGFLTSAILSYQSSLTDVQNKANDIANSILEWFGYTYDTEGNLEKTGNRLSNILKTIGSISAIIGGVKIANGIKMLTTAFSGMGGISGIASLISPFTIIVSILTLMYATNEDFRESIDGLLASVMDLLLPVMQVILVVIEAIMPLVTTIVNELSFILFPIINAISPIISQIGDVITSLLPIIKVIVEIIAGALIVALDVVFVAFNTIWGVLEVIVQILSGAFQIALGVIVSLVEAIKGGFATVGEFLKAVVQGFKVLFTTGSFDGFVEAFGDMGEKLKEIWSNVWEAIKNTFKGIINNIIQGFASFVNGFTGIINDLTSTLSGAWEWLGIPAIPAIPEWNPPMLASGGVITQPTMAMVGEYKGASSNPEIVTPENLMREVFMESMLPIAQAIVSGDSRVVEAIQDLANRPIEMNGRKVSETIYSDLEDVAFRKGKTLAF